MQNYRRHTKIRSACLAGALRKCKLLATLQSLRWRTHDCRCCSSPIFALSKGIAKAMVWHRHLWLTSAKTVSGHMFYPCRLDPSKMFGQGLKSIQALFFTFLIMWWEKKARCWVSVQTLYGYLTISCVKFNLETSVKLHTPDLHCSMTFFNVCLQISLKRKHSKYSILNYFLEDINRKIKTA